MLVVAGVGTLIHIYAVGYMHEDVRHNDDPKRFRRFFVYLNLFIAAMMVLVSSDNYMMLFVGWEGVGLCSYLLIGFWFERERMASAIPWLQRRPSSQPDRRLWFHPGCADDVRRLPYI